MTGSKSALLVVDIQPDFLPGGALPVENGDEILEPIDRLMRSGRFRLCAATQDFALPMTWHQSPFFLRHQPSERRQCSVWL